MRSENPTPIQFQPTPENRGQLKRHHTARYYAHRVKESLTTKICKLICAIFLGLFFLIGLTTFFLWLSLRPCCPIFQVHQFSIPALPQQQIGNLENAHVIYNVTARNPNQDFGIYYDSTQLTVYYQEQSIGGSPLLFPFYQKPKNTTVIAGDLKVTGRQWHQFTADLGRGEVVFRVEITSVIRFKISSWDSKRYKMHANCPAGVGPDGFILPSYKLKKCAVYFS